MKRERRQRRPSQADLKAAGASPGLIAHRVGPDGRARLQQLTPESDVRRKDFARRLTTLSKADENSPREDQETGRSP